MEDGVILLGIAKAVYHFADVLSIFHISGILRVHFHQTVKETKSPGFPIRDILYRQSLPDPPRAEALLL